MFIRWSRRPIRTKLRYLDCRHSGRMKRESIAASLARTERRDGKIRQRIVGPIGLGVRSCCLNDPLIRARFWRFALEDLDRHKIDGLMRVRVVLQLAAVVKPPSEAEWAMYERSRQQKVGVPRENGTEMAAPEAELTDSKKTEVATLHANSGTLVSDMAHEVSSKRGVP